MDLDCSRVVRSCLAGALVGVLAIVSVVVTTKILENPKLLGASTTFVRSAGPIEKAVAPGHVEGNAYPALKSTALTWGSLGKITRPGILGVSPWIVIPLFTAGCCSCSGCSRNGGSDGLIPGADLRTPVR